MALLDQDPSDLLDDNSLHPDKTLGVHYPPYLKWMNFCSLMVGLFAFGGALLFGAFTVSVLPDLFKRLLRPYHRPEEYLFVLFILGSFACCLLLLWGCWRAFEYRRSLRSATFVGASDAERWLHASAQGNRLWKTCAAATVALVLAWGPLLLYFGYDEIDRYLWAPEVEEPFPMETVPAGEWIEEVPEEAPADME